jgi:peptidoglycan/LPS O-acetylase OafA/YrhL
MSAAPRNLKALTTLRYFAAIWVVLFHYWDSLTNAAMPSVVAKGYLGVELFFVLSGFILCHVYLQSAGEGGFRYGGFLWTRLARIYPLHLATLFGLGLVAIAARGVGMDMGDKVLVWSSLPAQLLLAQAWGLAPNGGWNHPSWSISAEWMAYLAFPVFAFVAWRLRGRPRVAVVMALVFTAGLYFAFSRISGQSLTRATIAWGALRIVPCFAYGCALYLAWRAEPAKDSRWAPLAALGFLAAIVGSVAISAPDALSVGLFGGLIFWLARFAERPSPMTSRVGVYLGEVSFAVYMVCIPWQLVFAHVAGRILHLPAGPLPWPVWAIMLAGLTPVAMLAHHLVERPARLAMRGWTLGPSLAKTPQPVV